MELSAQQVEAKLNSVFSQISDLDSQITDECERHQQAMNAINNKKKAIKRQLTEISKIVTEGQ